MTYTPPTPCPHCGKDSLFDHCFSCGRVGSYGVKHNQGFWLMITFAGGYAMGMLMAWVMK